MANAILSDDITIKNARLAVKEELCKRKLLHQPIAKFDVDTGEVYIGTGDSNKRVVGKAMQQGRYSQRMK